MATIILNDPAFKFLPIMVVLIIVTDSHLEELPIRYVTIIVHIVNAESKAQFGFLISFDTELWHTLDKFCQGRVKQFIICLLKLQNKVDGKFIVLTFKVHFAIPVRIENVYYSLN